MTIEQNAGMAASFARKVRDQFLVWLEVAGGSLKSLSKLRFARTVTGIKTYLWVAFAIALAVNVVAFDYYQARITRYYLGVLLMNLIKMSEDIDTLDAKLNQLSAKIDDLSSKLDKRPAPPPPIPTTPPSPPPAKARSK
jgi:hypothetical protein